MPDARGVCVLWGTRANSAGWLCALGGGRLSQRSFGGLTNTYESGAAGTSGVSATGALLGNLMSFEPVILFILHLLTQYGKDWRYLLADDSASTITFVTAAITVLALAARLSLVIGQVRRGGQTMKESEAAVRHFLRF